MPNNSPRFSFTCNRCGNVIGGTDDGSPAMISAIEGAPDAYCPKCGAEGRIIKVRDNRQPN